MNELKQIKREHVNKQKEEGRKQKTREEKRSVKGKRGVERRREYECWESNREEENREEEKG